MSVETKKTPLSDEHRAMGAKMAPFANFDMPLQYSSVKDEALSVRRECGIFDVSHMGEFLIEGPQAVKFVDYLLCNDFLSAEVGKAVYSPLCRENGTVIDDMISYKISEQKVLICVNAANIQKDWSWFAEHVQNFDCKLTDQSEQYALVAVQGPKAEETLTKLGLESFAEQNPFTVREIQWQGNPLLVARTGYTGEDGAEIFCSPDMVTVLWRDLLALGAKPCGLASRDVLRLEACFPLYGHEIHNDVTPLDSALKWTVKLDRGDFIGKEALSQYNPKFKLIKLTLEKGIPREQYPVYLRGQEVGHVTSGTMSVTLGKGIALAHINADIPKEEKQFEIGIRKRTYPATKQSKSFLRGGQ